MCLVRNVTGQKCHCLTVLSVFDSFVSFPSLKGPERPREAQWGHSGCHSGVTVVVSVVSNCGVIVVVSGCHKRWISVFLNIYIFPYLGPFKGRPWHSDKFSKFSKILEMWRNGVHISAHFGTFWSFSDILVSNPLYYAAWSIRTDKTRKTRKTTENGDFRVFLLKGPSKPRGF